MLPMRADAAKISDDTMMEFTANPRNDGILRDGVRRESRGYIVSRPENPHRDSANLWSDEL